MQAAGNQWYVQVSGQAYGPYSHDQMLGFIAEGRIIPESLVSQNAQLGFLSADKTPEFGPRLAPKLQPLAPAPVQTPLQTPKQDVTPQPLSPRLAEPVEAAIMREETPSPTPEPASGAKVYFLMAEIRSGKSMGFLQALQALGPAQRIGDAVWLVQSAHPIEALRNSLSSTLTRQDRLFIVDSRDNKTAWFNLGADMDGRIRALFQGG